MRALWVAIALCLVVPASAAARIAGHWSGGGDHLLVDFLVEEQRPGHWRVLDALVQYRNVRPECRWKSAVSFGNGALAGNAFAIQRPGGSRLSGLFRTDGARGDVRSLEGNGCPSTVFGWTARRVAAPFLADGPWSGRIGGLALAFDVLHGGRVVGDVRGEVPSCGGGTAPFHGKYRNSIIDADHRFRVTLPGRSPSQLHGTFFPDVASAQGFVRKISHQGCDSSWLGWAAAPR